MEKKRMQSKPNPEALKGYFDSCDEGICQSLKSWLERTYPTQFDPMSPVNFHRINREISDLLNKLERQSVDHYREHIYKYESLKKDYEYLEKNFKELESKIKTINLMLLNATFSDRLRFLFSPTRRKK